MNFKEWFFFGRKYEKLNWLERNKYLEKLVITNSIIALLLILIGTMYFSWVITKDYQNINFELNEINESLMTYDNLSDSEISLSREALDGLKPYYLSGIKEITFTKDLTKYENHGKDVAGFERGRKIYIKFRRDVDSMQRTIAHEIMHRWLIDDTGDKNSPGHKIVYDLAKARKEFMYE